MSVRLRTFYVVLILALLVLGPWWYASWRTRAYRNFHVVRNGVLYRSGQLTLAGLKRKVHDHGIRTVISLRYPDDPADTPPDQAEEDWCLKNEVRFVRLRGKAWHAEQGEPPIEENIRQFHQIMTNPVHYPVLIHCYAGVHRTGAYCSIFRMEYDGWPLEKAITEMQAHGYNIIYEHQDVLGFLRKYEPRGYRLGSPTHLPGILPVDYRGPIDQ